jgi:hypothetical protein
MKSEHEIRGLVTGGNQTVLAASIALLAAAAGCAGPAQGNTAGEPAATVAQALRCRDDGIVGDPLSGDCPWRTPWSRVLPQNRVDISHAWAPAMLSSDTGWLVFSVDTTNHYRMLQMRPVGPTSASPSWGTYGPTRTWKSKPALAHRENSSTGLPGFVVAGKLNDNTVVTSSGIMAASSNTLGTPTPDKAFEVVEANRTYSTGGLPAITEYNAFGVDGLVVTFMGDDGHIYAHTRSIPYNTNHWSARITGPALPSGWSAVYGPAISAEYAPNLLAILIHARNGSTDAFFLTHFVYTPSQAAFANEIGSPAQVWTQIASVGAISDDPTFTMSPSAGLTAYYRRGTQIVETGWTPDPHHPVLPVAPSTGIQFSSSPGATGDRFYDQGTHLVVARAGTQLYWIESNSDDHLDPGTTD